jgi:hypothetical protein
MVFSYKDRRWRIASDAALDLADYRCEHPFGCPNRGGLTVHHKVPPWRAPHLAFKQSNLIVLCPKHHQYCHRHYIGWTQFIIEQAANDDQFEFPLVPPSFVKTA